MDIEIVDSSSVDKARKPAVKEGRPGRAKLDFFDDPIRMYLHQMGQVPLLTREQEVEICKRIEKAEIGVRKLFNDFGFAAEMYLELASRLENGEERFDRVVTDKFVDSRDKYLKFLPRIKKEVSKLHGRLMKKFKDASKVRGGKALSRKQKVLDKMRQQLAASFEKLHFKQKVIESMASKAEDYYREFKSRDADLIRFNKQRPSRKREEAIVSTRKHLDVLLHKFCMPKEMSLQRFSELRESMRQGQKARTEMV